MNKEALHALEANGFQRATSDGGILVKLPSAHSASSIVRIEPLTGPTEMENSSSSSAVAAAAFAFDALPLVKDKTWVAIEYSMFKINSKTHRNLSSVKNDEEEKGATGTFMDSSLSRQSPGGFRFQFGKRSVLKGLEWGLAAVLQHQKSYKAASTSCSLSNIQILITDPMNYLSYYSNSCGTGTGNGTGTVLGGGGEDQLENVWDNDDCMIRFDVDIKNVERKYIDISTRLTHAIQLKTLATTHFHSGDHQTAFSLYQSALTHLGSSTWGTHGDSHLLQVVDVKVALELNVARCAVKIGGGGDDGGGGGGGGFDKIAGEVLGLSSSTSGSGSACFEFLAGNTSDDDDDDDSESKISSLTGIAFVRYRIREKYWTKYCFRSAQVLSSMSQWDEAVGMLDRYLNKMKKKTSSTRDNDDQQSLIHEFTRERDRILALKVKSIQQEKQFYQRMFQ